MENYIFLDNENCEKKYLFVCFLVNFVRMYTSISELFLITHTAFIRYNRMPFLSRISKKNRRYCFIDNVLLWNSFSPIVNIYLFDTRKTILTTKGIKNIFTIHYKGYLSGMFTSEAPLWMCLSIIRSLTHSITNSQTHPVTNFFVISFKISVKKLSLRKRKCFCPKFNHVRCVLPLKVVS